MKAYSAIYMGEFNSSDTQVFSLIIKVTSDFQVGSIIEFRPLSEDEFELVKESAVKNCAKLLYSEYDESMKDSVKMRILDGEKENAARRRAVKQK